MGTDRDWEKWGSRNPYYGVLSADKYQADNMSEQDMNDFFESGERHVNMIFDTIGRVFGPSRPFDRVLDFGCGVGRLVLPLASRSNHVTGMDVSPSMLDEARCNCEQRNVSNCELVLSDDHLSQAKGSFDLVHSSLVLQHIPARRGHQIIREMLGRVAPGGFAAIQCLYRCNAPAALRAMVKLRYVVPPINYVRNLYRKRPLFEPPMQLHLYDLSEIFHLLNTLGFRDVHTLLGSQDDGTYDSAFIFARREETP